jgi:hypothetical protein
LANLDLRPLSLGELLDRTFSIYRQNFALFVGITAIPQLLVLAINLFNALFGTIPQIPARPRIGTIPAPPQPLHISTGLIGATIFGALAFVIVYLIAYLLIQGATFFAVSEIYLGRKASISDSIRRMRGNILKLFGVTILNGLALMAGFICLIFPGFYLACRLLVCVPAALLEDLGPSDSLTRSFDLTRDEAGRAFVILFLCWVLSVTASALFQFPFQMLAVMSFKDPSALRVWSEFASVGTFLATTLVTPILTIATAVFYYDLRVRKEAFDLQVMMDETNPPATAAPNAPPSLA